MTTDPESTYRHLVIDCPTVRDVWAALTAVPPDELDDLLMCALRHAESSEHNDWLPEAHRRTALMVLSLICDRVLYVMMGVPRSPDAHI